MGRPKTYDREDVVRKAMALFWMHGFHGTSTQMLVDEMGINRFSLFAEFGTKQGLFEAAMDLYMREVVERYFGALHTSDARLDDVERVFEFFADTAEDPIADRGCFLTNVAAERGPLDGASLDVVHAYVARITKGIERALKNGKAAGALREGVRVKDESRMMGSTLLGIFVLKRAVVPAAELRGATRAAIAHLRSLAA